MPVNHSVMIEPISELQDFNYFIKQMERADFVPLGAGLRRLKATP